MKNLTWQNPEQLFVAQELINKVKSKCCGIKANQKTFHNWTKEMGLMTTHFNALSGTLRKNNNFIFGSSNGAVDFNKDMKLPRTYSTKMIFSDFKLFYHCLLYTSHQECYLAKSGNSQFPDNRRAVQRCFYRYRR